mgnify:CR=1 FL=1
MYILRRAVKYTAIGVVSYIGVLSLGFIADIGSQPISSRSQLEQRIGWEKKRIGCNKKIDSEILNTDSFRVVKRDGRTIIQLGGIDITTSTLRHEIYHACLGHTDSSLDGKVNFPIPWLWYEAQVTLYELADVIDENRKDILK